MRWMTRIHYAIILAVVYIKTARGSARIVWARKCTTTSVAAAGFRIAAHCSSNDCVIASIHNIDNDHNCFGRRTVLFVFIVFFI